MNFKKRIRITIRGYKVLSKYCPGLIRAKVIAAIVETLMPFVTIWFSALVINEISGERRIRIIALYVILAIVLNFIFSIIRSAYAKVISVKESGMWNYFQKVFADKQMTMDYVDLENKDIQKQKQKTKENLFMFGNGLAQLVWDTPGFVMVIVGIVASVSLTVSLFLSKTGNSIIDSIIWMPMALLLMLLTGFIHSKLRKKEFKVFEKWSDGTVWYNRAFMFYGHELYDNTARAKDVRLYRQDRKADEEMVKLIEHNVKDNESINMMSLYQGKLVFSQGICNALMYIFVVVKAGMGAFAVGSLVQYVGALLKLVQSFSELFNVNSENKIYTEHLEDLFKYLDLEGKNSSGGKSINLINVLNGGTEHRIEFRNVSFKYPNGENYVLKNINVVLDVGRKQALVGANGAGKTTFVKLLARLYEPTEGEILLDGTDIREYDYNEYVQLLSFVFQDFKLFAFTLGENVAASDVFDSLKAKESLEKVSFKDRLKDLEAGLDTYLYKDVSEKGVEISGGEAQKIAMARALYKDAPIIVLDEPTAALDPIAEASIYEDFNNIVGNKTAIYISHRLSSCRFCDEITVFDEGRIVQRGTHQELVEDKMGKYSELWNAQAKYYQV